MTLETWMALWITAWLAIGCAWVWWSNSHQRRKRQELRRLARIIRCREAMRGMK
jgi:hypothetical protein